jgi:hypothetical protein
MSNELNKYRRNLFRLCYTNSFFPFQRCKIIGNKYHGQCKAIKITHYSFRMSENDPSKVTILWNGNHNWIMKIKLFFNGNIYIKRVLMNNCNSIFEMEQILLNQIHLIQSSEYFENNKHLITDEISF